MRDLEIETEMYRLAVELIEKHYPAGWGGIGVVHTENGHYFTSVSIDTANASAVPCVEAGAMLEAHKYNEKVTHFEKLRQRHTPKQAQKRHSLIAIPFSKVKFDINAVWGTFLTEGAPRGSFSVAVHDYDYI